MIFHYPHPALGCTIAFFFFFWPTLFPSPIPTSLYLPGCDHPTTTAAHARWHAYRSLLVASVCLMPSPILRVQGPISPSITARATLPGAGLLNTGGRSPSGRPSAPDIQVRERKTAGGGVKVLRLWIKSSPRIRLTLSKSY